ncbi:MAG: protein phosphatase 2C domain-containing protein, partial [Candidatus Eremiobacteraeota bacterium]|nr:protein phosphatase 2C domain-containing protein [Candidatus Eremiobacteraeota bacterium]
MEIAVGSNVGFWQVRQTDAHVADTIAPGVTLLAIADGFGAIGNGKPAAEVALATLRDYLRRRRGLALGPRPSAKSVRALLLAALEVVNARLYSLSGSNEDFVGSGTSLTAVMIVNGAAFVGHAGDSRAYLMRMGGLELLTADDA